MATNVDSILPQNMRALPCTYDLEFAIYDSLPPAIRQALQQAPLPLSAVSVRNAIHSSSNVDSVVEEIHSFAWNTVFTHPMHPNYPKLEPEFPLAEAKTKRRPPIRE